MRFQISLRRAVWLGLLATCLGTGALAAPPAAEPAPAKALDNSTCLSCHDGKKGKLEVTPAEGDKRALRSVMPGHPARSIRGQNEGLACKFPCFLVVRPWLYPGGWCRVGSL